MAEFLAVLDRLRAFVDGSPPQLSGLPPRSRRLRVSSRLIVDAELHHATGLPNRLTALTQSVNLVTLINVELAICLSRRNSGPYRCCTWNENLAGGA